MSTNTLEEIPAVNFVEEANRSRGVNYKTGEDIVLCHAWLSSSRDPVKGVYQTGEDFYDRVKAAFDEELRCMGKTVAERPPTSLNSRFQTISRAVSKFVGCHAQVLNVCASGRSPSDIEHDAIALYESKNGQFKHIQCWRVLRDTEKWGAWCSSTGKRKATSQSSRSRSRVIASSAPTVAEVVVPASNTIGEVNSAANELGMATVVNEEPKGASRTKLDRANLALYARQVKAAERAAANAEQRIRVAQDQYELSLFSLRSDANDPLIAEFLALKRQAVIKRLRVEAPQEENIRHSDPELVSTAGGGRGALPCDEQAHVVVTHTAQPVATTCVAEINTTPSNATSDANASQVV